MRNRDYCKYDKLTYIKMRQWVLIGVCVLVCLVILVPPASATKGPTVTIKPVITKVTELLKDPGLQGDAHRDERRQKIMSTIKTRFDFREMCKRVLGRTWRNINEAEKEHFAEIMTKLLENTYIGKLEDYHYKAIVYKDERVQGKRAQVSTMVEKGKKILPMYYLLEQTPKGWMVYDINIEGVSLVRNYAQQFRSILRTKTFDGLVKIIEAKNNTFEKTSSKS